MSLSFDRFPDRPRTVGGVAPSSFVVVTASMVMSPWRRARGMMSPGVRWCRTMVLALVLRALAMA